MNNGKPKVLAFTADDLEKVVRGQIQPQVGLQQQQDASRRLLKGKNVRQLPLTGSRGYGR
jgi:hypothetical protein